VNLAVLLTLRLADEMAALIGAHQPDTEPADDEFAARVSFCCDAAPKVNVVHKSCEGLAFMISVLEGPCT
jgi:hypothetical protein